MPARVTPPVKSSRLRRRLGAGVAKALLGKDVLPDDLPFVTGAIGLLGTKPSYDLMMGCDTLLMIGTGFPWSEFLPKDGQARAVQIDIDPAMLGIALSRRGQLARRFRADPASASALAEAPTTTAPGTMASSKASRNGGKPLRNAP